MINVIYFYFTEPTYRDEFIVLGRVNDLFKFYCEAGFWFV